MLKNHILLLLVLVGISCSLSTNAQTTGDRDVYSGGNGVYYISKDTMRDLIPAVVAFKQQHPECNITAMAGFNFHSASLLINCDPIKVAK